MPEISCESFPVDIHMGKYIRFTRLLISVNVSNIVNISDVELNSQT